MIDEELRANLKRLADDIRAFADAIEQGRWNRVDTTVAFDYEPKRRYSWEPAIGRTLVGCTLTVRMTEAVPQSSEENGDKS